MEVNVFIETNIAICVDFQQVVRLSVIQNEVRRNVEFLSDHLQKRNIRFLLSIDDQFQLMLRNPKRLSKVFILAPHIIH